MCFISLHIEYDKQNAGLYSTVCIRESLGIQALRLISPGLCQINKVPSQKFKKCFTLFFFAKYIYICQKTWKPVLAKCWFFL